MKKNEREKKILVVCTGNTCRSPLAEVIIADYQSRNALNDNFIVLSGGISAQNKEPASKHAIQAAYEFGLDLTGHASKKINQSLLDKSDLILCITNAHKFYLLHNFENLPGKCFTLAECTTSRDIPDPYGQDIDAYREIAAHMQNLMPSLLNFLTKFFSFA
jgi:protein-tyrosine phosphatase